MILGSNQNDVDLAAEFQTIGWSGNTQAVFIVIVNAGVRLGATRAPIEGAITDYAIDTIGLADFQIGPVTIKIKAGAKVYGAGGNGPMLNLGGKDGDPGGHAIR